MIIVCHVTQNWYEPSFDRIEGNIGMKSFFLLGENLSNFDLKNMISTYTKSGKKKWSKFATFSRNKIQITIFLW
jgi:hypothetical protein